MHVCRQRERETYLHADVCADTPDTVMCYIWVVHVYVHAYITYRVYIYVYIYIFIHHRIYFIWRSNGIILLAVQMFSKSL